MSLLIRSAFILVQALSDHLAFVPPDQTPQRGRYHTEEAYILQIAPAVFKIHSVLLWCAAALEIVYALNHYFRPILSSSLSAHVDSAICPASRTPILMSLFLTGVLLTIPATFIRIHGLGKLFTFDLSILPDHKLVTSGCYSYVHHLEYTGTMLIVIGLALPHMTAGSLLVEYSILGSTGFGVLRAAWWILTLSVGVSRAIAEDKELRKLFGAEWDAHAATTRAWFTPGLL